MLWLEIDEKGEEFPDDYKVQRSMSRAIASDLPTRFLRRVSLLERDQSAIGAPLDGDTITLVFQATCIGAQPGDKNQVIAPP